MAALQIESSGISHFDCKGDLVTQGQRWKRWKRSFEYFLTAKGVTDNDQKKALLLHLAGPDAQDIFETLVVADGNVYKTAIEALDKYFQPKVNIPYERHQFRQLKQEESESVDQFITRLLKQADF